MDRQLELALMVRAIECAARSSSEDGRAHPKVGAVLADANGSVLFTACRGETGAGHHAEFALLTHAEKNKIDLRDTELFVTLEPCTARGLGKTPCADRIVQSGIRRVHIGMLDPNPHILGRGETFLRWKGIHVERFPDELVRRVEAMNAAFIEQHRAAHLPESSVYVSTQISDLVLREIRSKGLAISELPYDWDVTADDLIQYCRTAGFSGSEAELAQLVFGARGRAFDQKYANYSYENDVRGFSDSWRAVLLEITASLGARTLADLHVLDVGIGNGSEGLALLSECKKLTIADVAEESVRIAAGRLPSARALVAPAEDLREIPSGSQEAYVSLRAFQSSYFDTAKATREAYRVLRLGGLFIASVANGFVGEGSSLIPGLVLPRTSVVDRDRPFEVVERIRRMLSLLRFSDVGVRSCEGEIFVFGRRSV